jgi:predicted Zn finger-like uncharacterized protein
MSLITQCPACSTMFRVVPDQLRISDGWVRCGQCDEVFEATGHLRDLGEPLNSPVPLPQPATGADLEPPKPVYDVAPSPAAPVWETVQPPSDGLRTEPAPEPSRYDTTWAEDMSVAQASDISDGWSPTVQAEMAPHGIDFDDMAHTRLDALMQDPPPSFMAAGRHVSTMRPVRRKKMWATGCAMLVLLLAAQVLLQERDRIAATSPALQPMLVAGCEVLDCKVSALREIESIVIDSSAFTSVRPGVYLLHVSLKNAASTALAMPALELTLTDAQDHPLLRRVVLPDELSDKRSMAAGVELGASLPINVQSSATPEKIAGYKLLAFYP